jgi:hypothetical protein
MNEMSVKETLLEKADVNNFTVICIILLVGTVVLSGLVYAGNAEDSFGAWKELWTLFATFAVGILTAFGIYKVAGNSGNPPS